MSQLSRVAKVLRRHTSGAGITVAKLAKLAGVPKNSVYKRVAELRQEPGRRVYANYRKVNGSRKLFYRIDDVKTSVPQIDRVLVVLEQNNSGPGISVGMLAKLAGVSKSVVYKRVADLRQKYGRDIYSNYRVVKGQRKLFYRLAA